MSRADRTLILLALIVLLLSLGMLFGYEGFLGQSRRDEGDAIATISANRGDIRVRFGNEIRWQKVQGPQKLLVDDAIFAGEDSSVDVELGASGIKVESNTLIVLRKESIFKSLRLDYGSLSGVLAKNDRFQIETADGEKIELRAGATSKIAIQRRGAKTSVKVIEGSAKVFKDGKAQELTSRDEVNFETKSQPDPLIFREPAMAWLYSSETQVRMHFQWAYSSGRKIDKQDHFTLEVAKEENFRQLVRRENVLAEDGVTLNFVTAGDFFYRVRDERQNFSDTRRLSLRNPKVPQLLAPKDQDVFDLEFGQAYPVEIQTTAVDPESKIVINVSQDPEFRQIRQTKTTLEPHVRFDLPLGEYYLRARTEYAQKTPAGDPLITDWSPARRFLIREKIPVSFLDRARLASLIVIPHHVARPQIPELPAFRDYFKSLMKSGHQLKVSRGQARLIEQGRFPADWIAPSTFKYKIQLWSNGMPVSEAREQELRIEMAPPENLKADNQGRVHWLPVEYAKAYELEVNGKPSLIARMSPSPRALPPGSEGVFRVRALGDKNRPISAWSSPESFRIPEPIIHLAEESPPLEERAPASTSEAAAALSTQVAPVRQKAWSRAGFWAWLGGGFNFLDMRQTVNNTADVNYQNANGPSWFAELGYMATSRLGAVFGFKRMPGETHLANYPVSNPKFNWDSLSLETIYGLPWVSHLFKQTLNWGLRIGAQRHYFPFLHIDTGRTVINSQSEMTTASLGFFLATTGRWKQHFEMRWQRPIESSTDGGNSFKISPVASLDGALGTSYVLTERLKAGFFWYGQYHNYDFTYKSSTQTNSGHQSLFYSNLEFRMGLEF